MPTCMEEACFAPAVELGKACIVPAIVWEDWRLTPGHAPFLLRIAQAVVMVWLLPRSACSANGL
ncbi:hypothetical protein HAX54_033778, partial [Datura stramonium]|nr:hypothetical protein [Datura stramonium]